MTLAATAPSSRAHDSSLWTPITYSLHSLDTLVKAGVTRGAEPSLDVHVWRKGEEGNATSRPADLTDVSDLAVITSAVNTDKMMGGSEEVSVLQDFGGS